MFCLYKYFFESDLVKVFVFVIIKNIIIVKESKDY